MAKFGNDYSTKDAMNMTAAARLSYDKTAAQHTIGEDTGFNKFRDACRRARLLFLGKKEKTEEEYKKLQQAKMYSNNYINEKIMALREEYSTAREAKLEELNAALDDVVSTCKQQIRDYTTAAPDNTTLKLLQVMQMRSSLSKTEVEMLIDRCSDNFQALSVVHDLADKSGMMFIMPINPADYLDNLDLAEKRCRGVLDSFDKPDNELRYFELEFYGDYSDTRVTQLFDVLDNPTITKDKTEVIDTLKAKAQAAQKKLSDAVEANDMDTARAAAGEVAKLNNFIRNNEGVMLDEEEKRRRARQEAAVLVSDTID